MALEHAPTPWQQISLARRGADYFGMSGTTEFIAAIVLSALMIVVRVVNILHYRFDSDEPQHLHLIWGWARGFVQYRDLFDNHMKNVFLTGASSGIGLAIAKLLVAEGHEVWGTSRNLQRIPATPRLHPVDLDLGNPRSVEEAFNAALEEASHFDVLINNAGAGHFGAAELLPLEVITSQFQILVFGQIQLMQLALRHMRVLVINKRHHESVWPATFL